MIFNNTIINYFLYRNVLGGQRAIMSLVLATAGSCICQQQILLLDEVDASLDELHCTRLAGLLTDDYVHRRTYVGGLHAQSTITIYS